MTTSNAVSLRMKSLNCRKEEEVLTSLMNSTIPDDWDIIHVHEVPYSITTKTFWSSTHWIPFFPTLTPTKDNPIRSLILVNSNIPSDSFVQLPFTSRDVVNLHFASLKLLIIGIYNDGTHNNTISSLNTYLSTIHLLSPSSPVHTLLLGDFNRHHALWSGDRCPRRRRDPTNKTMAEPLVELLAANDLQLALPPGTPTYWSARWKSWTTIDLAFVSGSLEDAVVRCHTAHEHGSDHHALVLHLDLKLIRNSFSPRPLFRETDWEKFHEVLGSRMTARPVALEKLDSPQLIDDAVTTLTEHFQEALKQATPVSKPSPYARRWWTKALSELRKRFHKAERRARRRNASEECREEASRCKREYFNAIRCQKRRHWREWLEAANERSVWLAYKYAAAPSNPTASRIPPLKKPDGGQATTSAEKCSVLLDTFFPLPP
ncbi:Endonuclease/exonuclease/phosphatase, partial [Favolaschia claudopus]